MATPLMLAARDAVRLAELAKERAGEAWKAADRLDHQRPESPESCAGWDRWRSAVAEWERLVRAADLAFAIAEAAQRSESEAP